MKKIGLLIIGLAIVAQAELSRTSGGTVKDSETKLEWQDSYKDDTIKNTTFSGAISYCEELELDSHTDWRLPNINELKTIVVDTQYAPSISAKFEYTASDNYWSSTHYVNSSYYVWGINFSDASVMGLYYRNYYTTQTNYVRCVRNFE